MEAIKNLVEKRVVKFALHRMIRRFVKQDLNVDQLEASIFGSATSFTINEMIELNEEVINKELAGTRVRLVRGTVERISGSLPFNVQATRELTIKGVDLVFDVQDLNEVRGADRSPQPEEYECQPDALGGERAKPRDLMMSSFLVGDVMTADFEEEEPAAAKAENLEEAGIEGLESLRIIVENIIHRTRGIVEDVTVRVNVPPKGKKLLPGQPHPEGTIAVIFSLSRLELFDVSQKEGVTAFSSFSKSVEFTGISVHVADSLDLRRVNNIVTNNDLVLQGPLTISNQLKIDVADKAECALNPRQPKWCADFLVSEVHVVLTPPQLVRLVGFMECVMHAPDATGATRSTGAGEQTPSKLQLRVRSITGCLLRSGRDALTVGAAWSQYASTGEAPYNTLRIPHYGVSVEKVTAVFSSPTQQSASDDVFREAFMKYGVTQLDVYVKGATIRERIPHSSVYLEIFSLEKIASVQHKYLAAVCIRATVPMVSEVAHSFTTHAGGSRRTTILQDTVVDLPCKLTIEADVGVLDRVLSYSQIVQNARSAAEQVANIPSSDSEGEAFFGDALSAMDLSEMQHVTEDVKIVTRTPPPPVNPELANVAKVIQTTRVTLAQLRCAMRFEKSRRPSKDLYGPLLQRLFDHLCVTSPSPKHLRWELVLEVSGIEAVYPNDDDGTFPRLDILGNALTLRMFDAKTHVHKTLAQVDGRREGRGVRVTIRRRDDGKVLPLDPPTISVNDSTNARRHAQDELSKQCGMLVDVHFANLLGEMFQDDVLMLSFMLSEMSERLSAPKAEADTMSDTEESGAAQPAAAADAASPTTLPDSPQFHTVMDTFQDALDEDPVVLPANAKAPTPPPPKAATPPPAPGAPPTATAADFYVEHVALQPATPPVVFQLFVKNATVDIRAARLNEDLTPVGESMAAFLPSGCNRDWAFRAIKLSLQQLSVFTFIVTGADGSSDITVTADVHTVDIFERECAPPPGFNNVPRGGRTVAWGTDVPHLRGYAALHSKANHATGPLPPMVRSMTKYCVSVGAKTQRIKVDVALDRTLVYHRVAHDGGNWLLALTTFFSDTPQPYAADTNGAPAAAPVMISPFQSVTNVTVVATETLAEYKPLGALTCAVLLVPRCTLTTGDIVSTSERVVLEVTLSDVTGMLNDEFMPDFIQLDRDKGAMSPFGTSRGSIQQDMVKLGFIPLLETEHGKPLHVTVRMYDDTEKPLIVTIDGLDITLNAATDSLAMFIQLLTTYGNGDEAQFLPTAHDYIEANGDAFVVVPRKEPPPVYPMHCHRVADLKGSIAAAMGAEIIDAQPRPAAAQGPTLAPPPTPSPDEAPQPTMQTEGMHFDVNADYFGSDKFRDAPRRSQLANRWETSPGFTGLADCITEEHHFSSTNHALRIHTGRKAEPLGSLPKPLLELILSRCNLTLRLYGGKDFHMQISSHVIEEAQSEGLGQLSEEYDLLDDIETIAGARILRSSRHRNESVVSTWKGIYMQVDSFPLSSKTAMRIVADVKDVEFIDCVHNSVVKELLGCSIPKIERDEGSKVLRFRWVSVRPIHSPDKLATEERLWVHLLPLRVNLSQPMLGLLTKLVNAPPPAVAHSAVTVSPDPPPPPLYFQQLTVYPTRVTFSWYPSAVDVTNLVRGNAMEFAHLMSVEGSQFTTGKIVVESCQATEIGPKVFEQIAPCLQQEALLLLCGLQPFRTLSEVGAAAGDLVLVPLESFKSNRSMYRGIMNGLASCTRRIATEGLTVTAGVAQVGHTQLQNMTRGIRPPGAQLSRGDQPHTMAGGMSRAADIIRRTYGSMGDVVSLVRDDGSIASLPLMALLPIDGALAAMTHIVWGARSSVNPERSSEESKKFKGSHEH